VSTSQLGSGMRQIAGCVSSLSGQMDSTSATKICLCAMPKISQTYSAEQLSAIQQGMRRGEPIPYEMEDIFDSCSNQMPGR